MKKSKYKINRLPKENKHKRHANISLFVALLFSSLTLAGLLISLSDKGKLKGDIRLEPLEDLPGATSGFISPLIYIIGGIALLIVIVTVIIILVIQRRKNKTINTPVESVKEEAPLENNLFDKSDFDFDYANKSLENKTVQTTAQSVQAKPAEKYKNKIERLIDEAEKALERNDTEYAKKMYDELYSEYNELEDEEKEPFYMKITELYKKLV